MNTPESCKDADAADSLEEIFGEVISVYTRAMALEDGTLVDLSRFDATKRFFKLPLACTSAVWNGLEAMSRDGLGPVEKLLAEMMHHAQCAAFIASKRPGGSDRASFRFRRIKDARIHCGPGDDGAPVLTIMLADEN